MADGFLQSVEYSFGTSDLYDVLSLNRNASDNSIRRAYYAMSLKVHPDRIPDEGDQKKIATKKFQILTKIYSVLSDKELKAIYDETGQVDDCDKIDNDKDWDAYWRLLFNKIKVADIEAFEKKYKGSEEELFDLKSSYIEYKGNMDDIMEVMLCCNEEDEPRFREYLEAAIKSKEVPSFDAFVKETDKQRKARQKRAKKEAEEAKQIKESLGIDNISSDDKLKELILKNQASREEQMNSFFDNLEQKYAPAKKTKSGKKVKRLKK